jgi:hypothetical protein
MKIEKWKIRTNSSEVIEEQALRSVLVHENDDDEEGAGVDFTNILSAAFS